MSQGKLYLIPTHLGEYAPAFLPPLVTQVIPDVDVFIIENIKFARRYLRSLDKSYPIDDKVFFEINKRTNDYELSQFIKNNKNKTIGVISEAGCPGIADPGAEAVKIAHENDIKVIPISGPSSIYMALMASGKNGQNFSFNGYISKEKNLRRKEISKFESLSNTGCTQLFMDTPFRNNHVLEDILNTCKKNTILCIACDISLPNEYIKSQTIENWKKTKLDLNKRPCIFIL